MLIILIFTFILGLSIVNLFGRTLSILEKTGLASIIGLGFHTVIFFILTLIHIPITQLSIWVYTLVFIAIFNIPTFKNKTYPLNLTAQDKIEITLPWLMFAGLIIYLVYGITLKCLFWPVAEYDSMTGYDLMGKMIAKEGTLNVSIFQYSRNNTYEIARFIYPPLTAGCFALSYIFDGDNSKITITVLFVSFLITFYGFLRKSVKDLWAIFFTFFMMITPEMFSHASLGLTNLPNAIYTSLALIALIYWLKDRDKTYFIVSLLLLVFSVWSRSDSIVFIAGCGLVLAVDFLKTKEWKMPLIYLIVSLIPFIVWTLFVKINVGANSSDFFVKYLFWDWEKFSTVYGKGLNLMLGNGTLYGITFYVPVVLLAINIVNIVLNKNATVILLLSTWFLYTFLYYQMDYNFAGSIDAYLNASYKRGLFNFIPIAWFFIATSPLTLKFIAKAEHWMYGKE